MGFEQFRVQARQILDDMDQLIRNLDRKLSRVERTNILVRLNRNLDRLRVAARTAVTDLYGKERLLV